MDYKADINQSSKDNANLKKILAEGESDIRTRVIDFVESGGSKAEEVSRRFQVSVRSV